MRILNHYKKGRAGKYFLILSAFIAVSIISTSCICPLFSFLENFTGLDVKTGNEVELELVIDELIYPGSKVLIQVTGDIERIMELVSQYGVAFSQDELDVMDNLPEEMRKQEISAIIYSTLDKKPEVQDHYNSLGQKDWDIQEFNSMGPEPGSENTILLFASKEERRQALLMTGTENNTFIIFFDFDWEVFEKGE